MKQYVWFQANFQFQYRSDGETIVYALYQDVTSRMRMKEKLQHNIKTMRTAMDQCGVYYALYDIDANTITYNSKMQQDFGVPAVAQRNAGKPRRLMTESGIDPVGAGSTDDDRSYGIRHYERKGRGKAF